MVKDNPYEDTEGLYDALRFLGTTYLLARRGEQPCPDLGATYCETCGFSYEPHQSDITIGMYKDYYTTRWEGKTIKLKSHIGKGTSKDARYCIRVAFEYDETDRVVVIGFLGQHQKTGAS